MLSSTGHTVSVQYCLSFYILSNYNRRMEGLEETRKLSTSCLASEKTGPGSIKDPTRIPQKANDRNQQGPVSSDPSTALITSVTTFTFTGEETPRPTEHTGSSFHPQEQVWLWLTRPHHQPGPLRRLRGQKERTVGLKLTVLIL